MNKDVYEGEFVANRSNGKGRYTKANGEIYEGFWVEDRPHG